MTPEEMERTMQFIVETQAQTAATIQRHEEAMAANEKNIAALERIASRHDQDIKTVTDMIGRLAIGMTELTGRMSSLAESQKETSELLKGTDERLNALILIVDKIIRGRNGGAKL